MIKQILKPLILFRNIDFWDSGDFGYYLRQTIVTTVKNSQNTILLIFRSPLWKVNKVVYNLFDCHLYLSVLFPVQNTAYKLVAVEW